MLRTRDLSGKHQNMSGIEVIISFLPSEPAQRNFAQMFPYKKHGLVYHSDIYINEQLRLYVGRALDS
jgi:hypothetical protein